MRSDCPSDDPWLKSLQAPRYTARIQGVGLDIQSRHLTPVFKESSGHTCFYVREGTILIHLDARVESLGPTDFIWIAEGTRFAMESNRSLKPPRFHGMGLYITDAPDNPEPVSPKPYYRRTHVRRIATVIEQIAYERDHPQSTHPHILHSLVALLATLILCEESMGDNTPGTLSSVDMHRIESWVIETLPDPISPADLASLLLMHPAYFSRKFKLTYKHSPRSWLGRQRLMASAQHLLKTTDNVSETAEIFGYADIYSYSRLFKAQFGVSPNAYRRQHFQG